jgi:hypothetical protein
MPGHWKLQIFFPFLDILVTCIAKHIGFLAMQQRLCLRHIMHVGCRANQGMYQPRLGIHADVCLHAEMPLIAFLGLMKLLAIPLSAMKHALSGWLWCICSSRLPCWFLVDEGAAMIVASAMVPARMNKPCSARCALMAEKMAACCHRFDFDPDARISLTQASGLLIVAGIGIVGNRHGSVQFRHLGQSSTGGNTLAEAAALLILRKKVQAIWGENEED